MEQDNSDIRKTLSQAQRKHLKAMEQWARQQGRVSGIPVIQAITYELIQYVNQAYLSRLLAERQETDG